MWRLRGRRAFAALARDGVRARRGPVAVMFRADATLAAPRVGYSVSRRAGTAVVRNRIRRRLRAVVHDLADRLRPGDYLISATTPAATLPFGELRQAVADAVDTVHRRAR